MSTTIADYEKYKEVYGSLLDEELRLEDHFSTLARELLQKSINKTCERGGTSTTIVGQKLVNYSFDECKEAVEKWYDDIIAPHKGVRPSYLHLLKKITEVYTSKPKEGEENPQVNRERMFLTLTLIPLMSLLDRIGGQEDIIINNVLPAIASHIEEEVSVESFIKDIPSHTLTGLLNGVKERGSRHYKVYYAKQAMLKNRFEWHKWDKKDALHLSMQLVEIIVGASGYFTYATRVSHKGSEMVVVEPTEWLLEAWAKNNDKLLAHTYRECPMVIPPIPWSSVHGGGYYGALFGRHSLLRASALQSNAGASSAFNKAYLRRLEETDLSKVYTALNAIQETPWRINKKIYGVLKAVIERGGDFGGIPSLEPKEQLPDLVGEFTEEALKKHKRDKSEIYHENKKSKSKVLRVLNHFKIAQEYLKFERIYFPYNMDFRGRVYPISVFSPQSDDINKSLLEFADAPPCQSMEDIGWLMIHGANEAGVDKVSFKDRKQWVIDNEEHILKSATDPMNYTWWTQQDDTSFQLLSFCFEWKRWREYYQEHKTAKGFVCNIPIAFDGTCSGLQHYSAILRDSTGGTSVNLVPGDKPNDIYGVVAAKVRESLEIDVRKGTKDQEVTYEPDSSNPNGRTVLKLGTKSLAQQWLAFGVDRKVTKRSVMTLPYGSKEFGFKAQIYEDIVKKAIEEGKGGMFIFPQQSAAYMAKRIWQAVQTVVVKAMEGMKYLQDLSRIVCKEGQLITWTSPLGLPIQQAYMEERSVKTMMRLGGGVRRWAYWNEGTGNIDKKAQAQGIAPNFIHSMDASHLQLTVLNAKSQGINHFALIHDSFGCPPSQASVLFKVIRGSFYDLYTSHDVLKEFTDELLSLIDCPKKLPIIPEKGNLDLKVIMHSQYMFA